MADERFPPRRKEWTEGPDSAVGWLALSDDDLLYRIASLPPAHAEDATLIEVVRSNRHFFVRQEAAKRVRDQDILRDHSVDRHIGQILVRGMTRAEDLAYLRKLTTDSRHLEVRKAAEAQLRVIEERLGRSRSRS